MLNAAANATSNFLMWGSWMAFWAHRRRASHCSRLECQRPSRHSWGMQAAADAAPALGGASGSASPGEIQTFGSDLTLSHQGGSSTATYMPQPTVTASMPPENAAQATSFDLPWSTTLRLASAVFQNWSGTVAASVYTPQQGSTLDYLMGDWSPNAIAYNYGCPVFCRGVCDEELRSTKREPICWRATTEPPFKRILPTRPE